MSIRLLVPGTTKQWFCGGLLTVLRLAKVLSVTRDVQVITYEQRETEYPYLDDLLHESGYDADVLYIVSWGPHIPRLVRRLRDQNVAAWTHSYGWGYTLPPQVPILCASRFTMGLWAEDAPRSPVFYLPNPLGDEFSPGTGARDIDVLHFGRKSSSYVSEQLLPVLRERCRVENINSYVDDVAGLLKRSKVFLYDSRDYWVGKGVSEGFGLPPLEAMACGCSVFSSVNAGLVDFLDPGFNCQQVGVFATSNDVERILRELEKPSRVCPALDRYRGPAIRARWDVLEPLIFEHIHRTGRLKSDIRPAATKGLRRYRPPAIPLRWKAWQLLRMVRDRVRGVS